MGSNIENDIKFIRMMIYKFYKVKNEYEVTRIMRRYGLEFDDIFQLACMAYMKAEKKFDKSKGVKLITYAGFLITQELKGIARHHTMSKRDENNVTKLSINKLIDNEKSETELEGLLSDDVDFEEVAINRTYVEWLLSHLTDEERYCVVQNVMNDVKQREIGKELGIAQKNVSVRVRKGISKLKELV